MERKRKTPSTEKELSILDCMNKFCNQDNGECSYTKPCYLKSILHEGKYFCLKGVENDKICKTSA